MLGLYKVIVEMRVSDDPFGIVEHEFSFNVIFNCNLDPIKFRNSELQSFILSMGEMQTNLGSVYDIFELGGNKSCISLELLEVDMTPVEDTFIMLDSATDELKV